MLRSALSRKRSITILIVNFDRVWGVGFKIPRSRASFAAIASSRAVRSVPSIVFFSRSSALLSGVRNKDLALQPFDQRSLGLRNSLVSILSFLGGSLDEFGLSDFILIFIFPHFPLPPGTVDQDVEETYR